MVSNWNEHLAGGAITNQRKGISIDGLFSFLESSTGERHMGRKHW